jgi:hypothetical protein
MMLKVKSILFQMPVIQERILLDICEASGEMDHHVVYANANEKCGNHFSEPVFKNFQIVECLSNP